MSKRAWETETSRGGEKQSIIKKEEMEKKKRGSLKIQEKSTMV